MTARLTESSLLRYVKLVASVIPNATGLALCDSDGERIQIHSIRQTVDTQASVDALQSQCPDWYASRTVQSHTTNAAGRYFITVGIRDNQDQIVANLVVVVAGKPPKTSRAPMLTPIAECIGQEMSLNAELDSMTAELTERYEELNLVYHTEDQVNFFRESREALRNLTQNCLDYLDVGLAVLILREKGVATTCHHPLEPIPSGDSVAMKLATSLYQWVQDNDETVVINDMSDTLAVSILPGLPYRVLCCPISDASGKVAGIIATVNHYSRQKFSNSDKNLLQVMARKASKIVHANYDGLTGLANRNGYEHFLESAFMQVKEFDSERCLLHINIDQLHIINDTVSFAAGDEIIRHVAEVIDHQKRDGDNLSRLGGDEFGLILDDCSFDDASEFAKRICRNVEESTTEFEGAGYKTTVSVGVALLTSASESVAQVMGVAEVACSVAKDQGRNRVESYRPDDVAMVRREEQMHQVAQIQSALANNNFVLYAQQIQALEPDGTSHHTEILLRNVTEDGEIVAPGNFIPAAERYHLMPSIDRWVVTNTLSTLSEMSGDSLRSGTFAINLSGQSLNESSFLDFVRQEIKNASIPAQCICFEITETATVANLSRAMKFISSLKKLGCTFSLDDFGAGLSSFGYLKTLPVDYLKIDGGIVKDIVADETSAAMVAAINQVGHTMNLQTIAEFVENEAILSMLRQIGVDYAQGYGIGKPVPLVNRLQELSTTPAAIAS